MTVVVNELTVIFRVAKQRIESIRLESRGPARGRNWTKFGPHLEVRGGA